MKNSPRTTHVKELVELSVYQGIVKVPLPERSVVGVVGSGWTLARQLPWCWRACICPVCCASLFHGLLMRLGGGHVLRAALRRCEGGVPTFLLPRRPLAAIPSRRCCVNHTPVASLAALLLPSL